MIRRLLRTSGSCASSSERNFSATKRPPLRSKTCGWRIVVSPIFP